MEPVTIFEHNVWDPTETVWVNEAAKSDFQHYLLERWATDAQLESVRPLMDAAIATRLDRENQCFLVAPYKDGLVKVTTSKNSDWVFNIAAPTLTVADSILSELKELVPLASEPSESQVFINFWSRSANGPSSVRRRIEVPAWGEIDGNYSKKVRTELDKFMDYKNGKWSTSGQLILWQGEPGTGKTFALRALTRAWRKWCEFHYITDPEKFFGSDSDYMLSVILKNDNNTYDPYDDDEEDRKSKDKWKLLILEDCGEMLASDAKQQVGQGLSRLLNVVDGLIGQGLKLLILVTTNEELRRLNPAVSRYGRCSSKIGFSSLDSQEIAEWAKVHDMDLPASHAKNVSELYALLAGKKEALVPLGFS